ncbi:WCX domain-containing protein [Actinomyces polynesiensis]
MRAGAAHEVRLRATGIHKGEDGWDVVDGAPDEIHSWISAVLPVATDVVVLGPAALRDEVLTRLRAARDWHRAGEGHHA